MIKRIIVSGDLLRVKKVNGIPSNFHEKRINKYYDFFYYQLSEATNLPVEKLNTDVTDFDPSNFYLECNIPYGTDEDWLKIYDLKEIPQRAVDYFASYINDSMVIYIEMPLIFKRIHNLLKIPYIDLTVHPIRFLDDHLFGMSTNEKKIFDKLKQYQVDENQFYLYANMIKATVDYNPLPIKENSALIAGQTNVDKALYSNGRCLSIMDFEEKIWEMGQTYDLVYYKAHPFNSDLRAIHSFLKKFPFVKLCPSDWNVYKMLSNPNLKKVYAITSGVLYEAKYFNKESESLYTPYLHLDYSKECNYDENTYLSIYNNFLNPIFWKYVLQDIVNINHECKDVTLPNRPNRLRAVFNDYWSYTELDPTVITVSKRYNDRIRKLEKECSNYSSVSDYKILNDKIDDLLSRNAFLETRINILSNDPCFEKNMFVGVAKRVALNLSQKNLRFNSYLILKKLKREALPYIEERIEGEKITAVKGITYRPHAPHGGRGGGGAVLSAMQAILGNHVGRYDITYNYSERDGLWHTLNNRYFTYKNYERFINKQSHLIPLYAAIAFVIEKTRYEKSKLYICHDYATAYGLSLLKKKYILVIHSQGTRVDEKITLGEPLTADERKVIMKCEKTAIENALAVTFPSKGAEQSYFSSKYCLVDREKANVAEPLYNTVYYSPKPSKIPKLEDQKDAITFTSIGTMTEAKGQDRVCEFFDHFLPAHEEQKIRWICIGKGPKQDEVEQKISELERKYSNFECVRYNKLNFAQVQYALSISQVYIMLQRTAIFDLSILEAMNHNCALILSEVGGNVEFNVCDNVLFSTEKAELKYDVTNKEVLQKLRQLNTKAYETQFSNRCFKEEYEKLIVSVIDEYNLSNK